MYLHWFCLQYVVSRSLQIWDKKGNGKYEETEEADSEEAA
jgi:hypothetical protein